MSKMDRQDNSEEYAARLRDKALKRALSMPPQPKKSDSNGTATKASSKPRRAKGRARKA